jgi:crotonobetainyl-CoA:carnitine CoA-transferase CaiB-like acyl-CoA transferase
MALLVSLDHRRQTGEGVLVEAAMIDAALNIAAEQVVEFSAYGKLLARAGNRGPTAAPQNLYLTADIDESGQADCWVAIAVADDVQWTGLLRALGNPDWAEDPAIAGARGRAEHQDVIDEQLAKWCAGRSGDAIVERLWAAGVPVAKVLQPHHQSELPPLQARGFFEGLDHPVAGPARYSTLPMRFSRGPQTLHTRHAPLLGEHSAEVLREVGLAEAAITSLETDGVTGRQPARRTI